ncbi:MAG: aminodeoxychorismate/anthranilate synthase component II [Candidatus Delongbacteria bacterium]|nr:aminodeoxychorismate/anthranilate synthase component II [Candidatus Delongbacteria bacterium]MBN2835810.1 aminodeoxychorismate/anthranilate synthase component II [Candidatus Delongbacteria bacterium]
MKTLFIDNFDSFTYNLVRYFKLAGAETDVVRNNFPIDSIFYEKYDSIVISPGPGTPKDSGISLKVLEKCTGKIPILGVCLGMQCINELYGGKTILAPYPCHGKKSILIHSELDLFSNIRQKTTIARYHSLIIDPAKQLKVDSWTENDNLPMSIIDKKNLIFAVQFHPESFMTQDGLKMIQNFCISTSKNLKS